MDGLDETCSPCGAKGGGKTKPKPLTYVSGRATGTIPLPSGIFSQGVSVAGHLCCRAPLFVDPSFNILVRGLTNNFQSLLLGPVSCAWSLDLPLEAPREPHWSVSQVSSVFTRPLTDFQ